MKIAEAATKLTADGRGRVILGIWCEGTDMAQVQVFLHAEGKDPVGPRMVPAAGATEADIVATLSDLRAAVADLAA